MTRRPGSAEDAPELAGLMTELGVAAGADPGYTSDSVRAWFSSGIVRDPAADTRLVLAGDGSLAAAALLAAPADGGRRVDAFGGVLPAWRGRGLGRELLGWQVERARHMRQELAPDAPWELDTDAYTTEDGALHLFERFGFRPVRYWFTMARALDGQLVTPGAVPDGLRVTTFTPDLARPLYEAHVETFADHYDYEPRDFDSWAEEELRTADFRPDLTRIALDGDDIAGYVVVSDEPDERVRVELVGTQRSWRRRGLASVLLAQVLAAAAAEGKRQATLGVDSESPTGAVSVYERAGFAVVSSWISYRLPISKAGQPEY
jgi:mycothiol synthase